MESFVIWCWMYKKRAVNIFSASANDFWVSGSSQSTAHFAWLLSGTVICLDISAELLTRANFSIPVILTIIILGEVFWSNSFL